MGCFVRSGRFGMGRFFKSVRNGMGCFVRGDKSSMGCFVPLIQEPVIGLIKWLRQKGLKLCSFVKKCADFKNQTLKKSAGT